MSADSSGLEAYGTSARKARGYDHCSAVDGEEFEPEWSHESGDRPGLVAYGT